MAQTRLFATYVGIAGLLLLGTCAALNRRNIEASLLVNRGIPLSVVSLRTYSGEQDEFAPSLYRKLDSELSRSGFRFENGDAILGETLLDQDAIRTYVRRRGWTTTRVQVSLHKDRFKLGLEVFASLYRWEDDQVVYDEHGEAGTELNSIEDRVFGKTHSLHTMGELHEN